MDDASSDLRRQHDDYLAKAEAAEKSAAVAIDDLARDGWVKIAESYRDMAARIDKRMNPGRPSGD